MFIPILILVSLTTLPFAILWLRACFQRDLNQRLLEIEEESSHYYMSTTEDARKERDEWRHTAEIYHQQAREFNERLNDALEEQRIEEIHQELFDPSWIHETHGRN